MQINSVLFAIVAFAVGNATAAVPRNFIDGKGSALFGNAGTACSVGAQDGECDKFGRCVQFIPPNEQSILNQGKEVDTCTAGGQTGTL
ncbi:hypothetical protein CH063_01124 [Colletotrichum higginsianum]|uniref:Uncharacterized protein n=2 Tax=Colletotrichum higginsianum TaxID=80884 RepID=H1V2A5_COLHI|nr:hypothetical protein CH63R_02020 [Colletotrichum higginsianum IMI 349063]OBR13294.1 hypothetical protein CH63R_02020 [Colletotrichum higginsianum IMI 349063]TID02211.1 hypothetical protein CH35J_003539 [Colletotrichum higginsianum]GJC96029.1 hypothetical protein ColKHC_04855 [Colletotrichum higginsianum]CCF34357.1 hypothetical protein CH063_01124 [Colletotrichum higginsianum]